jgi:hypothetical protein
VSAASVLPAAPPDAIAPDGEPRWGAYAGSLERVEVARAFPGSSGALTRAARLKRWQYVLVASDEVLAAVAVVEAGLFGGAFFWAVDRVAGTLLAERSATGVPRLTARVNERPGGGARASFTGVGLDVRIERRSDRYRVEVSAAGGVGLDAHLDARAAPPPFVLVVPVPGGGFRATQKAGALPASGVLRAGGRSFALDGGTGGLDATYGLLARETAWRWAFGTGRLAGGEPMAFNVAEGFAGVPEGDPGENALLLAAGPSRLPPCTFAFARDAPLSPWRVTGGDGAVDLEFRPIAAHHEERDLVLLRTRFVQVAGTFTGRLPAPGGGSVSVAGLPGVVEDHWALW